MNIFKNRYRILEHSPTNFEPQVWRWWCPFWECVSLIDVDGARFAYFPASFGTKERAEEECYRHANPPKPPQLKIYPLEIK